MRLYEPQTDHPHLLIMCPRMSFILGGKSKADKDLRRAIVDARTNSILLAAQPMSPPKHLQKQKMRNRERRMPALVS